MNSKQACEIIEEIAADHGEPVLETLMYMQDNLEGFPQHHQLAFHVFMRDARQLFARK